MNDKIKVWISQRPNQYLLLGIVALVIMAVLFPAKKEKAESPQMFEADTVIPAGFVLVPIELLNFEALSSLVGGYAIVDLFAPASEPGQKSKKIGSDLRLLRAPLNPNQFAVLVPEEESEIIVSQASPLVAVIQNRTKTEQSKMVRGAKIKRSRIEEMN